MLNAWFQALHQYFRRYEPYPLPAILTVLGCGVLLQAAISYFSKGKLSLSPQTVVENAAVTAATLFLSIATYRLSPWHPLARYPGPLLHRLTKLRVAYASWFGTNFRDIKAMHEKYGPVVRVGAFLIADPFSTQLLVLSMRLQARTSYPSRKCLLSKRFIAVCLKTNVSLLKEYEGSRRFSYSAHSLSRSPAR